MFLGGMRRQECVLHMQKLCFLSLVCLGSFLKDLVNVFCILMFFVMFLGHCQDFGVLYILNATDFEKIQREQTLELPPKPPQKRFWRGSLAVPFAGNNMLVLYSCPDSNSSKYVVQVLHNEHPTPLPVSIP